MVAHKLFLQQSHFEINTCKENTKNSFYARKSELHGQFSFKFFIEYDLTFSIAAL